MPVRSVYQTDVLDLRPAFDDGGRPLDLQVLDNRYRIAIRQFIAVGVADDARSLRIGGAVLRVPFMASFGAHPQAAIGIDMLAPTGGAFQVGRH